MAENRKWKDLEIERKTTKTFELKIKKNKVANDITGWTIYFTVKENMNDTDTNAKIDKTITSHSDAVNGITEVTLSSSDTDLTPKNYYYSMDFKDAEGNIGILLQGRLKIRKPVRDIRV